MQTPKKDQLVRRGFPEERRFELNPKECLGFKAACGPSGN
jgi:hypothetical protein